MIAESSRIASGVAFQRDSSYGRTITGAEVSVGNNASVSFKRVLNEGANHTKSSVALAFDKRACQKVLGDKADVVLNLRNGAGQFSAEQRFFKTAARILYTFNKNPNVADTKKYADVLAVLQKAVVAYDKDGESGFSIGYNAAKPNGAEVRIRNAINTLATGDVRLKALDAVYQECLCDQLPQVQMHRAGLIMSDEQANTQSSLFGNGSVAADGAVSRLIDLYEKQNGFTALEYLINVRLDLLDLGGNPQPLKETGVKCKPDDGLQRYTVGHGGIYNHNQIDLKGLFDPIISFLKEEIADLKGEIKDLKKNNGILGRGLLQDKLLDVQNKKPSNHDVSTLRNEVTVPSREVINMTTHTDADVVEDLNDRNSTSSKVKTPLGGASPSESRTLGVSVPVRPIVNDIDAATLIGDRQGEKPLESVASVALRKNRQRPAELDMNTLDGTKKGLALGLNIRLDDGRASVRANEHSSIHPVDISEPIVEPDQSKGEVKNLKFELDVRQMPKSAILSFDGPLNKSFFDQIASGIQGLSKHERALKSFIKEGNNPGEAKVDASHEAERYVYHIFTALKAHSPGFAARVESLFKQYYGAKTYGVGGAVVLSPGSTQAPSSFGSRADVG